MNIQEILSQYSISMDVIIPYIVEWGTKIILAILTIFIGFKIVWYMQKAFKKLMDMRDYDPMIESFISSLVGGLLKIMIFISAAGVLWVKTDSFVAMIAAAGFAIGMALSGTLQNFASGLIIVMFKPFKIWDYVELDNLGGTVDSIQIFNTIMLTPDKKTIVVPNSQITSSALINFSEQTQRRVDMEIGISYSDDIKKAQEILQEIAKEDSRIDSTKDVLSGVKTLWDNAVIIAFRFYVDTEQYWATWYDVTEKVKLRFDKEWINFPFPQREVHVINENESKEQ